MAIERLIPDELVDIANVQEAHAAELLDRPNVNAVAIGKKLVRGEETDETAVKVYVETKLDRALLSDDDLVPDQIDGMPLDVVEAGAIQVGGGQVIQVGPQALRRRVRPAFGGLSVAHFRVTAGTIATGAYDANAFPGIPPRYYILSNNHVLANSNAANIGDPVTQPGPVDGGTVPADVIGRLARFVNIRFHQGNDRPCNFVDAAIAEVPFEDIDRSIYWIGHVRRLGAAAVGMIVQKTGRTTNYTTGRVTDVNATVDVNYGSGRVARFCRQIITTNMSAGGDSGSLVLDLDENAVGLLFAGSAQIMIANPIALVLASLGIRITEL